jgi:LAO/AO transport system kinase
MAKAQANRPARARLHSRELCAAVLRGDQRAAARVLTLIDNGDPLARQVLKRLYGHTGRARIVGITGAAGSGKSTLIARLAEELRKREKNVGILAVDPTSPLSGGALLGDRIRMRAHFLDDGVFIRSLATRGSLGGISHAIFEAAQVLDAVGKDYVLIETIGIGQDQIDIAGAAHTVLTVISPESGDDVQGIKAGLFEITDLLVINKADLHGAHELAMKLASAPALDQVPIVKVSALRGDGMADLIARIDGIGAEAATTRGWAQRSMERARRQLLALLRDELTDRLKKRISSDHMENWVKRIAERRQDPYSAAQEILARLGF